MGNKLLVFCDGGARGNPGPAAIGVVVKDEKGKILTQFGKKIGETTNNVAEYMAVIEALEWLKGWVVGNELGSVGGLWGDDKKSSPPQLTTRPTTHCSLQIQFFLDSRLVVNQLNGLFKIKNSHIRELLFKIRELEAEIGGNVSYQLIPREKNWLADSLVNKALAH